MGVLWYTGKSKMVRSVPLSLILVCTLLNLLAFPSWGTGEIPANTPVQQCAMSSEAMAKGGHSCCCSERAEAAGVAEAIREPCGCNLTPAPTREPEPMGRVTTFSVLVLQPFTERVILPAPQTVVQTTPLQHVLQTPQTLPRAPNFGRAPPVA
jgi:hypothetical protein